jgi:Ankyrin repeat
MWLEPQSSLFDGWAGATRPGVVTMAEPLILPAVDPRAMALMSAIQTGDVAALERLLRDDPTLAVERIVHEKNTSRTLLHVAADWPGHFPNGARTVAVLIAAGTDPNAVCTHMAPHGARETALHWAASSNDVAVLDALLDGGADIEAPGAVFTGGPPMSDAVVFAQWKAARRLLERGATTASGAVVSAGAWCFGTLSGSHPSRRTSGDSNPGGLSPTTPWGCGCSAHSYRC